MAFEVLGQSVMEPDKAEEKKKYTLYAQFSKKYAKLSKKIIFLEEGLQSQEELINKLNQMNYQKDEALINQSKDPRKEGNAQKSLEESVKRLTDSVKHLKNENEKLKQQICQQKTLSSEHIFSLDQSMQAV